MYIVKSEGIIRHHGSIYWDPFCGDPHNAQSMCNFEGLARNKSCIVWVGKIIRPPRGSLQKTCTRPGGHWWSTGIVGWGEHSKSSRSDPPNCHYGRFFAFYQGVERSPFDRNILVQISNFLCHSKSKLQASTRSEARGISQLVICIQ